MDHTDQELDNSGINGPAQEEIGKPMEVRPCSSCGQRGHLRYECPSIGMSSTLDSSIEDNHKTSSPGPNVQPIEKTIGKKGRPQTRFISHRAVRRSQRVITEPSKHPKKRTVSALGTSGREGFEDSGQTIKTGDSEHEEALSSQIKIMCVEKSPSNEDSTHNNEPRNEDDCAESFLEV